jgi:uncharacterized membrane protein
MEYIVHHRAVNISKAERVISVIGGGLLAWAGIRKGSAGGWALALAGGDLVRRGITGHSYLFEAIGVRTAPCGQGFETTSVPYELGLRVDQSITIDRPRAEVYRFWRDLGNLPRVMRHIESIQVNGNDSHWVVKGPAGRKIEWDAVVHNDLADELIGWRSLPGSRVDHAGSVQFRDAAGGGTQVTVELQYNPPGGVFGALFAKMWGEEPTQQIEEDLGRLKESLEREIRAPEPVGV